MSRNSEVYRDHRGRFVARHVLLQGPLLPHNHPILLERRRRFWQGVRDRFAAELAKPNRMLLVLRERG